MNNNNLEIEKIVLDYWQKSFAEPTRYQSWIHCYRYFQTQFLYSKIVDYDLASLNLAFYLASWGMYRGSSLILQFDYKIYIDLLKKLKAQYPCLSYENAEKIEQLCEAFSEIYNYFENINKSYSKNKLPHATTTLVTKILLGIYGVIPAYDRFFIEGLSILNTKMNENIFTKNHFVNHTVNKNIFKKSVYSLVEFINKDYVKQQIKIVSKQLTQVDFIVPDMKIIDMYFWNIAQQQNS